MKCISGAVNGLAHAHAGLRRHTSLVSWCHLSSCYQNSPRYTSLNRPEVLRRHTSLVCWCHDTLISHRAIIRIPKHIIPGLPSSASATPRSCPRSSCCPTRWSRSRAGTGSPAGPGWRRWVPAGRRCRPARWVVCKLMFAITY